MSCDVQDTATTTTPPKKKQWFQMSRVLKWRNPTVTESSSGRARESSSVTVLFFNVD